MQFRRFILVASFFVFLIFFWRPFGITKVQGMEVWIIRTHLDLQYTFSFTRYTNIKSPHFSRFTNPSFYLFLIYILFIANILRQVEYNRITGKDRNNKYKKYNNDTKS